MNRRRVLVRAGGLSAAALFVLSGASPTVQASTTTAPSSAAAPAPAAGGTTGVTLNGEGSSDPTAELTGWQNDLFGSSGALNLGYLPTGGYKARQDLLSGSIDYAISGVPFTAAELAQVKGGAGALIDAPVMASALGVLVQPPDDAVPPDGFGWGILSVDADGNPSPSVPYTGPVDIPSPALAAMMLAFQPPGPNLDAWTAPSVIAAFGLTSKIVTNPDGSSTSYVPDSPQNEFPTSYVNSEPSEDDFYTQQFAATAAPSVWSAVEQTTNNAPITDSFPTGLGDSLTAEGLPNLLGKLLVSPTGGVGHIGGVLEGVPPSALGLLGGMVAPGEVNPVTWVNVQNAAGQYLAPSPQSINAAVNAGEDTPLYGLTNSVPGGYPLAYIDHLYAPAHGLSVDKTESLATVIRYLVTDGQQAMASHNDGTLPTKLQAQALAAANQLVLSNCASAGGMVEVSSDPGRLAPALPGLKAIGSMLHCNPTAAATPATGASGAAGPAVSSSGDLVPTSSLYGGDLSAGVSGANVPGSASGAGSAAPGSGSKGGKTKGAKGAGGAITLASLPISLPWSGSRPFDRLGALILGAGLFFAGRRVVAWLARLARP